MMAVSCPACGQSFDVTADDRALYDDISPTFNGQKYNLPSPTHCPACRYQRRLVWRNDRNLHHRQCDATGKPVLSMFPAGVSFPVYNSDTWWSDDWSALDYGQDIDFSRPFFEQYAELLAKVPLPALSAIRPTMENSNYCVHVGYIKNCYLIFDSRFSERCLYGKTMERSFDCVDCYKIFDCELCYEVTGGYNCHTCTYCQDCTNCSNCHYCSDLVGCKYCFGCVNLRNQEYCIFNEPYASPQEWKEQVAVLRQQHSSTDLLQRLHDKRRSTPRRWMYELNTDNCTGDYLTECSNSDDCFDCEYLQECKFCQDVKKNDEPNFHVYDVTHFGGNISECLECCSIGNTANHLAFSMHCYNDVSNLLYCLYCVSGSKHLFGCIGLKRAEHCILNKQYSQEEYERLAGKLVEHMKTTGEYGEFFPIGRSTYAYNESLAQEFFPLRKEAVRERGWQWLERVDDVSNAERKIPAAQLPDGIADVPDDILNWAIICEATERPFRIIKQELDFYRRLNLPVPHVHPDERHRRRMGLRNPRQLWDRQCGKCEQRIKTSYAPDRPEKVYCEECYLKEVY